MQFVVKDLGSSGAWLEPPKPNTKPKNQLTVSQAAPKAGQGGEVDRPPFKVTMAAAKTDVAAAKTDAVVSYNPANAPPLTADQLAEERAAFTQFRIGLDSLDLVPGGARLIANAAASLVPVPLQPQPPSGGSAPVDPMAPAFISSLFYFYGLEPSPMQIEMCPGMRLRVDCAPYQLATGSPPSAMDGYAAGGTSHWRVAARFPDQNITFDTFMSVLGPLQVIRPAGQPDYGSGVIDLQAAANARTYYKLYYPANFLGSKGLGSAAVPWNVTLVGADRLADLQNAYPTPVLEQGQVYTDFRGRVTITPEIPVSLNGNQTYLPVGTTFGQVLQGATNWSPVEIVANGGLNSPNLPIWKMTRYWGTLSAWNKGEQKLLPVPVTFETLPEPGTSMLDIPLLMGDSIRWGEQLPQ